MPKIIPAIMPQSLLDIDDAVRDMSGLVSLIQIDIMDGKFVPAATWPYSNDEYFQDVVEQNETLPSWEKIEYELDMMVKDPMLAMESWVSVGIARAILHIESLIDLEGTIEKFNNLYRIPDSPVGIDLMLAVPFDADPDMIKTVSDKIDGVQIMGISPVGVQGSVFKTETLETIKKFRAAFPDMQISVDGGVKKDMVKNILDAGANRMVMGSAIFAEENPRDALREILLEAY